MSEWNGRCQRCGVTTKENVEKCIVCFISKDEPKDAREIEPFILAKLTHTGQHNYCSACAAYRVKEEGGGRGLTYDAVITVTFRVPLGMDDPGGAMSCATNGALATNEVFNEFRISDVVVNHVSAVESQGD